MDPLYAVIAGLYLFLPAFLANSAAVLTGHGAPVDLGKSIGGKRILGDGKTWWGLIGGTLSGGFVGVLLMLLSKMVSGPTYGDTSTAILFPFVLAFGSLFGDMLGSFIKRRTGVERGAKFPILDQYDFVIGAFIIGLILIPSFMTSTYTFGNGIFALIAILALTPPLHRAVNIIGYKTGHKDVPW